MIDEIIRAKRAVLRLSQGELAELAGTSQPQISRIEAGAIIPDGELISRIAAALRLDPAELQAAIPQPAQVA